MDHRPDLAERCLLAAVDDLSTEDLQQIILRLQIAEAYSKCGDYSTAEQKCAEIVKQFADSPLQGKAIYQRFTYLAKQSKFAEALAEIDSALANPVCEAYIPELLYIKWWALRQTDQKETADEVGQELVAAYADRPLIAPVLLVQATDHLAGQRYSQCRDLLVRLTSKFPGTEATNKAQKLLEKLNQIDKTAK